MPVQSSDMKSTKQQQKTTGTSTTTTNISKKQKTNQKKMNSIPTAQNTIDLDGTSSAPSDIYEKIYNLVGKGASTNLGQYTIEKADGLLSVVEKTARWSLPDNLDQKSNSNKTTDKKSDKLERPCGWLPFLSLIVALRFARIGLSFGSIMIGNDPVTPESIVHFLQTRRRKLRAIKLQGLKSLRKKEKAAEEKAKNSPKGVVEKLSSLMNLVICRPGKIINYGSVISCVTSYSSSTTTTTTTTAASSSESVTTISNDIKSKNFDASNKNVLNTNKQKPQPAQKRPLEEDDDSAKEDYNSDEELHCTQLLDKYGSKGSDFEDSDYVPDEKEEDESSETDDGIDDDISNENISNNELISEEEKKDLSGKDQNYSLDTSPEFIFATPRVNGPLSLNAREEEEQQNITPTTTEQNKNSPSLSPTSELNSKSNDVNPVRLSPKIAQNGSSGDDEIYENFYDPVDVYDYDVQKGLRIRCRDLIRLSGGDECFFSPIGSPIVNDQSTNSYQQHYQLPSVVIDSVPSSSSTLEENLILTERTNDNSVNDNRLSINATAEAILKGAINKNNVNNIKLQNNYQQKQQQQRLKNNYKNNKGKKLH